MTRGDVTIWCENVCSDAPVHALRPSAVHALGMELSVRGDGIWRERVWQEKTAVMRGVPHVISRDTRIRLEIELALQGAARKTKSRPPKQPMSSRASTALPPSKDLLPLCGSHAAASLSETGSFTSRQLSNRGAIFKNSTSPLPFFNSA